MYIVAFEYTEAAGGYAGNRTWTRFSSKEEFDRLYRNKRHQEKIVAEGITEAEALLVTAQTSPRARVASAIQEATREDGALDNFVFQMQMQNAVFAIQADRETLRENGQELQPLRYCDIFPENHLDVLTAMGVDLDKVIFA